MASYHSLSGDGRSSLGDGRSRSTRSPSSREVRLAEGLPDRVRLMREIRFSIDGDWAKASQGTSDFTNGYPVTNPCGGWPSAVGIAPYLVLRIVVSGMPDGVTGYLVNIQELDTLLRTQAIPLATQSLTVAGARLTGEGLVRDILFAVAQRIPVPCALDSLTLWTTPYLSYSIHAGDTSMVELTQSFEFSASHRLHAPVLSEEENQRVFGKCNNPSGHGHNYRVEITVGGEVAEKTGSVMPLPVLEEVVMREVLERFDHKHLNTDVPEFAAVNPSVENIAAAIWRMLNGKLSPARLRRVRVWETAKTYAEYTEA